MRQATCSSTVPRLLALLAALLVSACGGGGGSHHDSPSLQGAYGFVLVEWIPANDFTRSTVGTLSTDGTGGLGLQVFRSVQAGRDVAVDLAPLRYTEVDPNTIVITDGRGRRFHGDIAADGSLLTATTRDGGTDPALLLLVRRASAATLSDLAGEWMEIAWGRETVTEGGALEIGDYAIALDETVDGAGEIRIDGGPRIHQGAYFFTPTIPDPLTFVEINPYGIVAWRRHLDDLTTHVGSLALDGGLLLLGGEYASTATGGTVMVRAGQPAAATGLGGTYRLSGLGSSLLGHYARWGTMTFGGSGAGSASFDHNVGGVILGPGSASFTYTVDAAGRLDVSWGDGEIPLRGMVGGGGAYVILAGGFEDGADAVFHVLVR